CRRGRRGSAGTDVMGCDGLCDGFRAYGAKNLGFPLYAALSRENMEKPVTTRHRKGTHHTSCLSSVITTVQTHHNPSRWERMKEAGSWQSKDGRRGSASKTMRRAAPGAAAIRSASYAGCSRSRSTRCSAAGAAAISGRRKTSESLNLLAGGKQARQV